MNFHETHSLTIDSKNRMSIPFAVRSAMNPEKEGRGFYVVPGRRLRTLALYPDKFFEERRKGLPSEEELSDEAYEWRLFECSQTIRVDPDNQGRVLIPQWLLDNAGVSKEVCLVGAQDHLELWNRAEFQAFAKDKWSEYPRYRTQAMREQKEIAAARGGSIASPRDASVQ